MEGKTIKLDHIPAYGVEVLNVGLVLVASEVTRIDIADRNSGAFASQYLSTRQLRDLFIDADEYLGQKQRQLDAEAELRYIDDYLAELAMEIAEDDEGEELTELDEVGIEIGNEDKEIEDGENSADSGDGAVHDSDDVASA